MILVNHENLNVQKIVNRILSVLSEEIVDLHETWEKDNLEFIRTLLTVSAIISSSAFIITLPKKDGAEDDFNALKNSYLGYIGDLISESEKTLILDKDIN